MIESRSFGTVDGFDIVAEVLPDYDANPSDCDECYGPVQLSAYNRDAWSYVGIVVKAKLRGFALGSASLWNLEYGLLPDDEGNARFIDPLDYMADDMQDIIDEAIENANREYAALVSSRYSKTEV